MFLRELLVFFLCFNTFFASVWSNSSKGNGSCVQRTMKGHCCQLPFTYKGKTYHTCIYDDSGYLLGIGSYLWCYYDQADNKYDKCKPKELIIPPISSTPATRTKAERTTSLHNSPSVSLNMTSSSSESFRDQVLVNSSPSPVYSPSPRRSTTTVPARSETGKRSSKTKQNTNIMLACGIGGGIILVMLLALTIIIYLRRKNKMSVKDEDGAEQHELNSYRMTDESNNPVYESIDKDLDINSRNAGNKSNNPVYESVDKDLNINVNDEQALQSPQFYHELEKPRSSTSCTDDDSTPNAASMSTSYGPKITPALNDTDSFTHFNELYITN